MSRGTSEKHRRPSEVEALHKHTLEVRRRVLGDTHSDTLTSAENLARIYVNQRRFAEAEPLVLLRAKALSTDPSVDAQGRRNARSSVADLYEAWNRPQDAATWRAQNESH